MVRPSETSPGNFTLFFYVDNQIHRYRIVQIGKYFHIGGRSFDSISAIIERYKREDLMEGNRRLVDWNFAKCKNSNSSNHNNNNSNDEDDDIDLDEVVDGVEDEEKNHIEDLIVSTLRSSFSREDDNEENYISIDVQSSILVNQLFGMSQQQQLNEHDSVKRHSVGPDIFTHRSDQVAIKGNLMKYSKLIHKRL